jgi:hypothetical protein
MTKKKKATGKVKKTAAGKVKKKKTATTAARGGACQLPLRHALATLAYRGHKAMAGAPPEFAGFRASPSSRTPLEIVAHLGDLFDWALGLADGEHVWRPAAPTSWDEQVERFFALLAAFDRRLASPKPVVCPAEKLFQGPVADALTHVGQINLLRRMAASPVRGENYFKAEIEAGRVGSDQAKPRVEFD